jgi:hypothetical protein
MILVNLPILVFVCVAEPLLAAMRPPAPRC